LDRGLVRAKQAAVISVFARFPTESISHLLVDFLFNARLCCVVFFDELHLFIEIRDKILTSLSRLRLNQQPLLLRKQTNLLPQLLRIQPDRIDLIFTKLIGVFFQAFPQQIFILVPHQSHFATFLFQEPCLHSHLFLLTIF
jgi:hypothetical protein